MPDLTAEQRARNVERVRKAAKDLAHVEAQIADVVARAPALLREVHDIRITIEQALSGAPQQEETDGD